MLLIADSGSTKADWILMDTHGDKVGETSTMGFNPFFHDARKVASELNKNAFFGTHGAQVQQVVFYGAGCSSQELNSKISEGLNQVFPHASITVDHDLTAAALATSEGEACIACILGTGSNSGYFDGERVHDDIPALGFILGDEGSGSFYGKRILRAFLYKQLPSRIHEKLAGEFGLTKASIFQSVYMEPHANVYLASFAKLLSDNRQDPWVEDLVTHGMLEFLSYHVCRFKRYREVPTHFVGSIAFYFEDILRSVAERRRVEVGKILKKPIYGLVDHHLRVQAG